MQQSKWGDFRITVARNAGMRSMKRSEAYYGLTMQTIILVTKFLVYKDHMETVMISGDTGHKEL